MILIIDNYDSFVHNLARYLKILKQEVLIFRNDKITVNEIINKKPTHIILSPGPKGPMDTGVSLELLSKIKIPVLGVCLGHQTIGAYFGSNVVHAPVPMHGKSSRIHIVKKSILFNGIPNNFNVGRYHSLVVSKLGFSKDLIVTSYCNDGQIMSLEHNKLPFFGVQFHPESIITEHGLKILNNFINLTK